MSMVSTLQAVTDYLQPSIKMQYNIFDYISLSDNLEGTNSPDFENLQFHIH